MVRVLGRGLATECKTGRYASLARDRGDDGNEAILRVAYARHTNFARKFQKNGHLADGTVPPTR